jgi:hypothetical protein
MKFTRVAKLIAVSLLLSALPLFGAWYRSNSVGQPLELMDQQSDDHRYVLQISETSDGMEEQTLYEYGQPVTYTRISGVSDRTVLQQYYDEDGNVIREMQTQYERGLPMRCITRIAGDDTQYMTLHAYAHDQLIETKELADGELQRLISYFRGDEGVLAGLRVVDLHGNMDQAHFSSDAGHTIYAQQSGDLFSRVTQYPHAILVRELWQGEHREIESQVHIDEAGTLVITEQRNGVEEERVYGPDGLLLRLETKTVDGKDRTISYQYDSQGVIDQSVERISGQEQIRIETYYRDGIAYTETRWTDDVPVRATRYLQDGTSVVTLFEAGRPYVDVTYAPDGQRVLSLEYRKEQ